MDRLIVDAIYDKKISQEDGERIQRNIDAVDFVSLKGRGNAILSCIKHMSKCKRIIQLAIREDKKVRKCQNEVQIR